MFACNDDKLKFYINIHLTPSHAGFLLDVIRADATLTPTLSIPARAVR